MNVSPLSDLATETLKLLVKQAVGQAKSKLAEATYSLAFIGEAEDDADKQAAAGAALIFVERAQNALSRAFGDA